VQDIAHVINYDLPEVAENFIHRVGRTGRNGKHGVASTLYVKEQRSELFHLERGLGIKMERLRADDASLPITPDRRSVTSAAHHERTPGSHTHSDRMHSTNGHSDRKPVNLPPIESAAKSQRFVLPGEVLQTQMDS
jgi:superfamily II DNA/RNA helicase